VTHGLSAKPLRIVNVLENVGENDDLEALALGELRQVLAQESRVREWCLAPGVLNGFAVDVETGDLVPVTRQRRGDVAAIAAADLEHPDLAGR